MCFIKFCLKCSLDLSQTQSWNIFIYYCVVLDLGGKENSYPFPLTLVTSQALKRCVLLCTWTDTYPNFTCFVTGEIDVKKKKLNYFQVSIGLRNNPPFPFLLFKKLLFWEGEGREKERERNISRLLFACAPTGNNLQTWHVPWPGIKLVAFCLQAGAQSTEPHQPRLLHFLSLKIFWGGRN